MNETEPVLEEVREAARQVHCELNALQVIEQGGTSTVFKGLYDNIVVAVKLLLQPDDEKWLYRLRLEYEAIKKLEYNRVVKTIGPGLIELNGKVALITEFISGESLRKKLERGPLSERDALTVLREVAAALEHVHAREIIHRDLHAGNVMLRDGSINDPVVIDFGTARDFSLHELNDSPIYHTFRPLGSMSHCAPEKWTSPHNARAKSDLFSVGVMMYRAVTGKAPFFSDSYIGLYEKIKHGQHVEAIQVAPISNNLNALIEELIDPDTLRRTGNAKNLKLRCDQLLENLGQGV